MAKSGGRALRADAERSVRVILEAAERVLAADPGASVEQIAEAAGVARTTVHRRFANRQALIEALTESAVAQLAEAVEDGRPDTAPPLVALHRITANVLRVKGAWGFALGRPAEPDSAASAGWDAVGARCLELLARAREEGLLAPSADLAWVRRVYYALIGEAFHHDGRDPNPDARAALVVDTLLHGVGRRPAG
ncbi:MULTISPECIES: TetR/AcrR family transcriptional regulator [unclassified Streptomyces]|uniref:TetR/AcrR family transcriptional regulator n=1 Tax=unclassified Streptomyces TaxID=2593676 RepID=UPI0022B6B86D|nr:MULTISPECIES: TetR/AcrR family transcriptional regulator [unclassified Streptomyces]MCZ7416247.1 TetR family transcriptional regulator [Streptomyces sp. WMMC897]MCZ7433943.1 TetR family transcriptional regulator [Streptomyces sp. WMMC1477]